MEVTNSFKFLQRLLRSSLLTTIEVKQENFVLNKSWHYMICRLIVFVFATASLFYIPQNSHQWNFLLELINYLIRPVLIALLFFFDASCDRKAINILNQLKKFESYFVRHGFKISGTLFRKYVVVHAVACITGAIVKVAITFIETRSFASIVFIVGVQIYTIISHFMTMHLNFYTYFLTVYFVGLNADLKLLIRRRKLASVEEVRKVRLLYDKLYFLTKTVENAFGLKSLVAFLNLCFKIVWYVYKSIKVLYVDSLDKYQYLLSDVLMLGHLLLLVYPVVVLRSYAQNIGRLANKVQMVVGEDRRTELTKTLNALSMQVLQQKVDFAPFGAFSFDGRLLYSVAGVTVTYLIILVQLNI